MTVVSTGYLGWIVTVLVYTVNHFTELGLANMAEREREFANRKSIVSIGFLLRTGIPLCLGFMFLFAQHSPGMYYLYLLFPVLFWGWILGNLGPTLGYLRKSKTKLKAKSTNTKQTSKTTSSFSMGIYALLAFICMQCSVVGYFHREVFSAALFGVTLWTTFGMWNPTAYNVISFFTQQKGQNFGILRALWWISCALVGVFPFVPIDFGESVPLVYVKCYSYVILIL